MTEEFETYFAKNIEFVHPYRSKEYKPRYIGLNKFTFPGEILKKYTELCASFGKVPGVEVAEIQKYVAEKTPAQEEDDEEKKVPITQFISEYLVANRNRWKMSPAWKEIEYTDNGVTSQKDLDTLRADIMLYIYENNLHYGIEEVKTALTVVAMRKHQEALESLVKSISYDPKFVDAGERYLHALYDFLKPTESYEVFSVIMKHWAWQVKRKVWNKEVINHIWVNLYGGTGIGKTTMLKKHTKPLDDFVSTTTISKLFEDTKEIKRLTENYVLIFDELALNVEGEASGSLSGDQKATLKSMLTGEKLDARVYGTQQQSKRKITFSCISSANEHLYDIIFDATSMRRFYELHCTAEKPESYDEINKYLDNSYVFWRSIDENLEKGYWDVHDEIGQRITKEQSEYYPTRTTTSLWVKANGVGPGKINISNAYKFYTTWCKETGNKCKTLQNFSADITHIVPSAVHEDGRIFLSYSNTQDEDEDMRVPESIGTPEHLADLY